MDMKKIGDFIDDNKVIFEKMSDQIWEYAELKFEEFKSSKLQADFLESQGFKISKDMDGLPTAFVAEYGSGKPCIGILGEYDALPFLSQKSDIFEHNPITPDGNGHGCGHNLLGTAGVEAATAIKEQIDKKELPGTIRYYGCPAEEGGSGKVLMAMEDAFKDVDICLSWHPSSAIGLFNSAKATINCTFKFEGISAHAALCPWQGRSALDAMELMNVGIQFLREHVPDDVRLHYEFTDHGSAANIVSPQAEGNYVVRSNSQETMMDVLERLKDIAVGAAYMTGTKVAYKVYSQYATFVRAPKLDLTLLKYLKLNSITDYTEEELKYAEEVSSICGNKNKKIAMITKADENLEKVPTASSDVADVSWMVPTGNFIAATAPIGCIQHKWIFTAVGKSDIAHKGMHYAAKVLAMSAAELMSDTELVKSIKREHEDMKGDMEYQFRIMKDFQYLKK